MNKTAQPDKTGRLLPFPRCVLPIALCLLLVASSAPAGAKQSTDGGELIFTGGQEHLWLVRFDREKGTFRIAARPTGGKWEPATKQPETGRPAAAAAGRNLHMFTSDGNYIFYNAEGERTIGLKPQQPLWPKDAPPAAMCLKYPVKQKTGGRVVAIVPRGDGTPTTSPATKPATAPAATTSAAATMPDGGKIVYGLFQDKTDQWKHLADLPEYADVDEESTLHLAAAGSDIYVMVDNPSQNILLQFDGEKWSRVNLDNRLAARPVAGMLGWKDRLGILFVVPGDAEQGQSATKPAAATKPAGMSAKLELAIFDPSDNRFTRQPVEKLRWRRDNIPMAARNAGQFALLWRQNDRLKLAVCDKTGGVLSKTDVEVFRQEVPTNHGQKYFSYFMWVVVGGIFFFLFVFRSNQMAGLFVLPEHVVPGTLTKRLVAGIIDLLIPSFVAGMIFPAPVESFEKLKELISQQQMPDTAVYAAITTMVLYALYCALMEWRFGATLGKMIFKLRVVSTGAVGCDFQQAMLRNLIKIIELTFLWPLPFPLLLMVPLINRNRQRLGDFIARTTVVDAVSLSKAPPAPPQPGGQDEDQPPPPPGENENQSGQPPSQQDEEK